MSNEENIETLPSFVLKALGEPTPADAEEIDPTDPRLTFSAGAVAELRRVDPKLWRDTFFPEYAGLPLSARKIYSTDRVKGSAAVPELQPWNYGGGPPQAPAHEILAGRAKGKIDEFCKRLVRLGNGLMGYENVPIEEYVAWCDGMNYYRNGGVSPWNGGPGLDPTVFAGGAYDLRFGRFSGAGRGTYFRNPIVTEAGTYFRHAGPTHRFKFGINGVFFPYGEIEPSYISDKWGPRYRDYRSIRPEDEPDQDNYDRESWQMCLEVLP